MSLPFSFAFVYLITNIFFLLYSFKYFKNLSYAIKYIKYFKKSKDKSEYTFTYKKYTYVLKYNEVDNSLTFYYYLTSTSTLVKSCSSLYFPFSTDIFTLLCVPSYVVYFYYLKFRLGLK
jgi:hypothetical protein